MTARGRTFRVHGTAQPGSPQTGPTYDCGGTPAEPPCLEDVTIFLMREGKRGVRQRLLSDDSGRLAQELEADIWERLNDADDYGRQEAADAKAARARGD